MDESLFYLGENVSQESDWLVEQAIPEDAEALAYMHGESFKDTYLNDDETHNAQVLAEAAAFVTPERLQQRIELIHHALTHSDKEFYVTVNNDHGIPAGFLYGYKDADTQELSALYVSKAYHGTGVAQALTTQFIDWCDRDKPIEVGVVIDNERAQRFYQKIGFHATGTAHESFYPFLEETKMILPERGDK